MSWKGLAKRISQRLEVYRFKIREASDRQLLELSEALGIGLNFEEMKACQRYFEARGIDPTDVELQTIGQTWSEHCFHKTFKGTILSPRGRILARNLLKTYIRRVTEELAKPWCVSVFEDNAGIVEFEGDYGIAIKVETHNHPSAIEPFGGAATGIGGVIRDILGVWAEPIANTDVLCFGPLDYPSDRLPQGIKHPRYIYRGVVAGIGSYGNNMGIPTVNGAIYFDDSYVGNVVVYCGCAGILPISKYIRDTRAGDIAILVGGRTGRDGIHGVTFASADLSEKSEEISRPAVQIPNPIEEEKLARAILQVRERGLASAITDLGGGGLSCAIGEMAHRSHLGAIVMLDRVPLKYQGMAPWEIWVSESQERMLLSAKPGNVEEILEIFRDEEVEATPVGEFSDKGILRVFHGSEEVACLDIEFLFNPPEAKRIAKWSKPKFQVPDFPEPQDLTRFLLRLLSSPNIASKEAVIRTYDHEVKGCTVLKPLEGFWSGPNDAAVLKPLEGSWKGLVLSSGMNPKYGFIDPFWMAASAVEEAVRNNVAVGGRRIALLDNFTWGNPERPDRMGSLLRAVQGCYWAAKALGTPFISGKDSLYNESPLGPVAPTLLITAIGIIPDVRSAVSVSLKSPGNPVYLIGRTYDELGGSHYYELMGFKGGKVPRLRIAQARGNMEVVTKAIDAGFVRSCHDLSEGGLGVSAAEAVLSSDYGLELSLEAFASLKVPARNDFILFSESNSRFLLEIQRDHQADFEKLARGSPYMLIGEVIKEPRLNIRGLQGNLIVDTPSKDLRKAWRSYLED
ncbi:MAG: phosphoribosylformylglycinamidine synthase subunit PurL [Candidatus Bathyarchaeia archaeon]